MVSPVLFIDLSGVVFLYILAFQNLVDRVLIDRRVLLTSEVVDGGDLLRFG